MKFTVITICHNNLEDVVATASSVAEQCLDDIEWILIDGSENHEITQFFRTVEIDNKKLISQADNGIYFGMNAGLRYASGSYVIFLNSGDKFFNPRTLSDVNNVLQDGSHFDLIYGGYILHSDGKMYEQAAKIACLLWLGMITSHQAIFYNNKTIQMNNLEYHTKYRLAADYDFTIRFIKSCKKISRINFPICVFDNHGASRQRAVESANEARKIRFEHYGRTVTYLVNVLRFMFARRW